MNDTDFDKLTELTELYSLGEIIDALVIIYEDNAQTWENLGKLSKADLLNEWASKLKQFQKQL